MLHGKKGFERVVWACKNVLNRSVTWLFHDFQPSLDRKSFLPSRWDDEEREGTDRALESIEDPLAKHHPVVTEVLPQTKTTEAIKLPDLSPTISEDDSELHDWALEMYEWISLVVVDSPRVSVMDSIDPFLSRYEKPQGDSRGRGHGNVLRLVSTTWTGFLPSNWIMGLFVDVL